MKGMSKITVNLNKQIGVISPHLYGALFDSGRYGMVDENSSIPNINGVRKGLADEIKRAHVGMLQWPSGDFFEYYDWRDGIGPRNQRPVRRSTHFMCSSPDDKVMTCPDDNALGTHEFLELCRYTGAEPYMGVSLSYGNAKDFHRWVEYCNFKCETTLSAMRKANGSPEPFNVRYWCVNNQGNYITPEEYCGKVRQCFGFVPYYFDSPMPVRMARVNDANETTRFFKSWKERGIYSFPSQPPGVINMCPNVDIILYIKYGETGSCINFTKEQWYRSIAYGMNFQVWIDKMREVFIESFNPDMKIGLCEWGCMHHDTYVQQGDYNQKDTLRDALTAAVSLNVFNNNCDFISLSTLSTLINIIQHLFEIKDDKLISTPTSFVYELYAPHHNGHCLDTIVEVSKIGDKETDTTAMAGSSEKTSVSIPHLQVSSSLKENVLTMTIVNTSIDNSIKSIINVTGRKMKDAEAMILCHQKPDAYNSAEYPQEVHLEPISVIIDKGRINHVFPAHSLTRITVRLY